MYVSDEHTFLHGVHTGVLVQMINLDDQLRDVSKRHAFVCALHTCQCMHMYRPD